MYLGVSAYIAGKRGIQDEFGNMLRKSSHCSWVAALLRGGR
jgi:hypothetical protein